MVTPEPIIASHGRFTVPLRRRVSIWVTTITLMILVTVLRISLPIYRQHVAIRQIEEIGGVVHTGKPTPGARWLVGNVRRLLHFAGADLTYEHASAFVDRVVEIEEINFFCDEDTFWRRSPGHICGPLPWVTGRTVNDANLECVVGLANLKCLDLRWTNVSDVGMRHVCQLYALEDLDVSGTDVSDLGLEDLKRLPQLRKLAISRTRVTDAGLACLGELASLRFLDLRDTKVSDAGVADLERALPGLTIDR